MPSNNQSAFTATAFQSEISPLEINPLAVAPNIYADPLRFSSTFSSSLTGLSSDGLDQADRLPNAFTSGYFTVGSTGQVSLDYLFDGGGYEGELAIFSLRGLDAFTTDLSTLTNEIVRRAVSDTVLGHVVIRDAMEGARFAGELGEANLNAGDYRGVQTFAMTAGDRFGVMLTPNGTISALQTNSNPQGSDRPLFSLVGLNPAFGFQMGQIADVDGNGSTFVLEDLRVDGESDRDYNDIIFQMRGAIGQAVSLDKVIDPTKDWRNTSTAKDLLSHIADSTAEFPFLTQRIWQDAGNRDQLLAAFSQSNDPRFNVAVEILRDAALKNQPDLDDLNAALTAQKASLVEALKDPANGDVLRSLQTNLVVYTPGFDAPNATIAQVFTSTVGRYGGAGYVGNPTGGVVRFGAGYVQSFDSGGAGTGAILYGDGYAQGVFLAGQEWQEFQAQGGVLTQGYPTENKPPSSDGGTVIDLPPTDISLPAPTGGQPNAPIAQPLAGEASVSISVSPIYRNPANGNSYLLTSADTWAGAQRQAVTSGGNLVTVNDAAEKDWLVSTFGKNPMWIGLTDSEIYGATEGNFRWVSGEPVTYTNWYPGAPDNATVATITPGGEDFIQMNFDSGGIPGRWNDLPGGYDPIANRVWNLFGITEILDRPPVVTPTNQTVLPGVSIAPSFTAVDPDGDPIQTYAFYDSNASSTSGYFTVNGVKQAAGQIIYVPANQRSTVRFVGGSPGDDGIFTAASDGYRWGNWAFSNVNTDLADGFGGPLQVGLGLSQFGEYVSDYDPIDNYRFTIDQRTRVNLNISDLSNDADLRLLDAVGNVLAASTAGGTLSDSITQDLNPGTYNVRVNRVFGSTTYKLSISGQVLQANRPPIVTASNQTISPGQSILPVFSTSDPDGNPITGYRFVDYNNGGGYFTVNGVAQPANQTIEVSAAQLSTVRFVGGALPGDDSVAISVSDGSLWSNLSGFTMMTDTAGNSVGTARTISLAPSSQSLTEYVSGADSYDFYRFSVTGRTRVELGIGGLSADADLQLLDASGNSIAYSGNSGAAADAIVRDVDAGTYYVRVNRAGTTGGTAYNFNYRGTAVASGPQFTNFSVSDASGDLTPNVVFQQGALRTAWTTTAPGTSVKVFARNNITGAIKDLLTSSSGLINLNGQPLAAGNYSFYAEARDANGNTGRSTEVPIEVLAFNRNNASSFKMGDFKDNNQVFSGMTEGSVFIGRGGSDTLDFSNIPYSNVTFDPARRTVFGGTTFDWLRINSTGQEVYFQGYESLKFAANQSLNLGVTPNDPLFSQQWNLQMMDVPGAWRFTKGNDSVMLGIADSGLKFNNGQLDAVDLGSLGTRVIASAAQDFDPVSDGHGTSVQSIIAAQSDNGVGVAGINWNSKVNVSQVFFDSPGDISVNQAFQELLDAAGNRKTILNYSGSTTPIGDANNNFVQKRNEDNSLKQVLADNPNNALFIASSGNSSSTGGQVKYPVNVVSQPADFAGTFGNAIAVGAVDPNGRRYGYSQYGSELTLVAPSAVPAESIPKSTITYNGEVYEFIDPRFPYQVRRLSDGAIGTAGFGGTSAAAPNVSGVASLVWSVNSSLGAGQVKDILKSTANQTWQTWGGSNSDNQYGAGLVDAEAAVRRADALGRSSDVASLFNNAGLFFS